MAKTQGRAKNLYFRTQELCKICLHPNRYSERKNHGDNREIAGFTNSILWCTRFMKRSHLHMKIKTKISQKSLAEYEEQIIKVSLFCL